MYDVICVLIEARDSVCQVYKERNLNIFVMKTTISSWFWSIECQLYSHRFSTPIFPVFFSCSLSSFCIGLFSPHFSSSFFPLTLISFPPSFFFLPFFHLSLLFFFCRSAYRLLIFSFQNTRMHKMHKTNSGSSGLLAQIPSGRKVASVQGATKS